MPKAEDYGWQPFDTLPDGTRRHVRFDADGKVHLKRETSMNTINAVLDANATVRNNSSDMNAERTMQRVARIPYALGLKWLAEEGWWFEDPKNADRLRKKLMDSDWSKLRTGGGNLAMGQSGEIR